MLPSRFFSAVPLCVVALAFPHGKVQGQCCHRGGMSTMMMLPPGSMTPGMTTPGLPFMQLVYQQQLMQMLTQQQLLQQQRQQFMQQPLPQQSKKQLENPLQKTNSPRTPGEDQQPITKKSTAPGSFPKAIARESSTLVRDPKEQEQRARQSFDRGVKAETEGKLLLAEVCYFNTFHLYPDSAIADQARAAHDRIEKYRAARAKK